MRQGLFLASFLNSLLLGGCALFSSSSQADDAYEILSFEGRKLLEAAEKSPDRPQALELYRRLIQLEPNYMRGHRAYQDLMITLGSKAEVWEEYAKKAKESPTAFHLTLEARLTDNPKEAERLLDGALSLDSEFYWAHYGLGVLQQKQDHWEASLRSFDAVIDIKPDMPEAYLQSAWILWKQGRSSKAADRYYRYLDPQGPVKGRDPDAMYNYACLLHETGKLDEAKVWYQEAIQKGDNRKQIDAFNNLGHIAVKQGKIAEALSFYDRMLQLDPTRIDALLNKAIVYEVYLRDAAQAIEFYKKYLDLGGPERFPELTNRFFLINTIQDLETQTKKGRL